MRPELLLAAVLLIVPTPVAAQSPPHLAGTIDLDLARGGISGNLCLSGLADTADTVRFVLHRGLNVKRVRRGDGAPVPYGTEPESRGVGLRYAVGGGAQDTSTAGGVTGRRVCVEYTGAFPVYDVQSGDHRLSDGSGVVAFNGRTLRARGETRWYPVPYARDTDEAHEALTFHLRIRCPSCRQLYINGTPLQPGPEADFVSGVPREIVILAGDYPAQRAAGMLLLGEDVHPDTARIFAERIAEVQRFHESFLGVPYGPPIDFARIVPVRVDRPFQMWGFFSDPLMGVTGLRVADFVEVLGDPGHPARPHLLGFLSHELAHRYFPGRLSGPQAAVYGEPFANYLGLKAMRHFFGDSVYLAEVQDLHRQVLAGPDLARLDSAEPRALADDHYRYRYLPLLLFALDRRIGEERMRRVLRALLTAPETEQANADYAFLRRTALRAGIQAAVWTNWEDECMRPPVSRNDCLRELLSVP